MAVLTAKKNQSLRPVFPNKSERVSRIFSRCQRAEKSRRANTQNHNHPPFLVAHTSSSAPASGLAAEALWTLSTLVSALDIYRLAQIADRLDVPIDWLLGRSKAVELDSRGNPNARRWPPHTPSVVKENVPPHGCRSGFQQRYIWKGWECPE
jgi:hypothetical protein